MILFYSDFGAFLRFNAKQNAPEKPILPFYHSLLFNGITSFGLSMVYSSFLSSENSFTFIVFSAMALTVLLTVTQFLPFLNLLVFDANLAQVHRKNVHMLSIVQSYICFPLCLLMYFSSLNFGEISIYFISICLALSIVLRMWYSVKCYTRLQRKNFLHLFFYLCTLEILPWIQLYHWVSLDFLHFT